MAYALQDEKVRDAANHERLLKMLDRGIDDMEAGRELPLAEVQKYRVIVTWEAIYDIAEITDYIEAQFGIARADRFLSPDSDKIRLVLPQSIDNLP